MKIATLSLLAIGLVLSTGSSAAERGSQRTAQSPVDFDHGIPVFELPAVVVTPAPSPSAPGRITHRARDAFATERDGESGTRPARPDRSTSPDTQYTAMRLAEH